MPDTRPRIVFDQNGVCNFVCIAKKLSIGVKEKFLKLIDEIHTKSKRKFFL